MKRKSEGITLVEMIAVIAILVIISALIYSLFGSSNKVFNRTYGHTKLQDEIRFISSSLENDIRLGNNKDIVFPVATSKEEVSFPGLLVSDPVITCNLKSILGVTTDVEVIYAFKKGEERYAYVLVGLNTEIRQLRKVKCDTSTTGIDMTTLSKNIKLITIDKTTDPYQLNIELEEKAGIIEKMKTRVANRN